MTSAGCPVNLRCAAVTFESPTDDPGGSVQLWEPRCVAEGPGGPTDMCSVSVDAGFGGAHLTDTCSRGLACSGTDGCRRICGADGGCPGASVCLFMFNNLTGSLGGACLPTCNPVTQRLDNGGQDCGLSRGCYRAGPGSSHICARAGVEPHGTELFFSMPPRAFANACLPAR